MLCIWYWVIKLFADHVLFSWAQKPFQYSAFLVSIGRSRTISEQKLRCPSEKFNMCNFYVSTQAFLANAVVVWEHWCPYTGRHLANTCMETKVNNIMWKARQLWTQYLLNIYEGFWLETKLKTNLLPSLQITSFLHRWLVLHWIMSSNSYWFIN